MAYLRGTSPQWAREIHGLLVCHEHGRAMVPRCNAFVLATLLMLVAAHDLCAEPPAVKAGASPAASRELQAAIAGLAAADVDQRGLAIARLAKLGPLAEPAAPQLVAMLADERLSSVATPDPLSFRATVPNLGTKAAIALGCIGPAAIEPLEKALADKNPVVRRRAAHALGRIADSRVVPLLIRAA